MPLEPKHVELPLSAGLDESTNREGGGNGYLELENCEWVDADSVARRRGFTRSVTWSTDGLERGLVAADNGLAIVSGGNITPCIPGLGLQPALISYGLSHRSLATLWNGRRVMRVDSAVIGSTAFVVLEEWLEDGTIATFSARQLSWRAVDIESGVVRASGTITGSGTIGAYAARVVILPATGTFMLVWFEGSNHNNASIKATTWVESTLVQGSVLSVATGAFTFSPEQALDAFCFPATATAYIAWSDGANIVINRVTASGVGTPFTDVAAVSVGGAVAVTGGGNTATRVVVAYSGVNNTEAAVYNTSLARQGGNTNVIPGTGFQLRTSAVFLAGTDTVRVVAEKGTTLQLQSRNLNAISFAGTSLPTLERLYLTTKLWEHPAYGVVLAGVTPTNAVTSGYRTVLVVDTNGGDPVGQFAFDEAGMWDAGGPASVTVTGTTLQPGLPWYTAVAVTEESPDDMHNTVEVNRARVVELSPAGEIVSKAQLGGVGFVSGSTPRVWDGQSVVPAAFAMAPEAPSLTAVAGPLTGAYSVVIVLEYTDGNGNIQVSPPSVPAAIVLVAQSISIALTFSVLPDAPVRCKIFRTLAGGSEYYLSIVFVVSGTTASVLDSGADVSLAARELLYTTGGVLESELAPPLSYLVAHRNRLFGVAADDAKLVRFTKETAAPLLPQWHSALTFRVDNDGGDVVALASMDDKLLIFQKNQICAITGQGPDNLDTPSTRFPLPEVVARGVGVDRDNRSSVAVTPAGIVFRHATGIYLLSRDLQVAPIGLPVQRTLGDFDVRSARYIPSRHQVWFFVAFSGFVDPPTILVWDVRYNRWSTFVGPWAIARDALEVDGTAFVLDYGGSGTAALYTALSGHTDNAGASDIHFPYSFGLPWFRGAGVNGQQRLWRVGLRGELPGPLAGDADGYTFALGAYTQRADRTNKAGETPDNTYTWTGAKLNNLPVGGFTLSGKVVTQRCSAFRVVLTATPSSSKTGPRFTHISYEYGVEPGRGKVPAGAKPSAT